MLDFLAPLWNLIVYNPMVNALLLLYNIIPNYGIAIILFTVAIALLTMPFRVKSQQAMRVQQEKQAVLKPKLDALKKKYKDNPQAYQQAQLELYREHGLANPFNMGCLLQLLPFPIFIGLYSTISAVMGAQPEQLMELSHHVYPFLPNLARLVPVNPNFFGLNLALTVSQSGIVVMAIMVGLVVVSSYVQQKMMVLPTASLDPQQAQMNQSMQMMMPLMMAFFVINFSVGLSLYWIAFSVIGIVQQYFTNGRSWGTLLGTPAETKRAAPKKMMPAPEPEIVEPEPAEDGQGNGAETATPAPVAQMKKANKGKKNRAKKS